MNACVDGTMGWRRCRDLLRPRDASNGFKLYQLVYAPSKRSEVQCRARMPGERWRQETEQNDQTLRSGMMLAVIKWIASVLD